MITDIMALEPQADVKDGFTISADTDNEKVLNVFKEYLATLSPKKESSFDWSNSNSVQSLCGNHPLTQSQF
ncbi:MAG: hypothetical protein K6E42_10175 [Synergistes sp.]|nr:hypothetical protein [Synergistes sp.]